MVRWYITWINWLDTCPWPSSYTTDPQFLVTSLSHLDASLIAVGPHPAGNFENGCGKTRVATLDRNVQPCFVGPQVLPVKGCYHFVPRLYFRQLWELQWLFAQERYLFFPENSHSQPLRHHRKQPQLLACGACGVSFNADPWGKWSKKKWLSQQLRLEPMDMSRPWELE